VSSTAEDLPLFHEVNPYADDEGDEPNDAGGLE
jgi:hypothetical protein